MRIHHKKSCTASLSGRLPLLFAIVALTNTLASGQGSASQHGIENRQSPQDQSRLSRFRDSSPLSSSGRAETLERPYVPITHRESFRWFVTSTIGPAHMAGVGFVSACGTAVNRPGEYGPHWGGFADRFGMGMAGSAAGNAIEVGLGLGLREDPRYFREPEQAFKSRAGRVARLTFLSRGRNGTFGPAYGRYIGIVGSNFLSNAWRVHSEANAKDALVRSSEGFAGRMAANAFAEFWPDLKKHLVRKHGRFANTNTIHGTRILTDKLPRD